MFDGDLVLLVNEPIMMSGVDRDCAIVLNIDEKMTALAEDVSSESIASLVKRTLVSLIGEDSNAATCYHNKPTVSDSAKQRYSTYVDILSIVNSFAIDFAKTGYIMQIPYHIAKYSKPYPYFMRYVGEYYESLYQATLKTGSKYKFHRSNKSNMNRLAFFVEKFHDKEIKWKRSQGFDYTIMIDGEIETDEEKFDAIEKIYLEFNKQIRYLAMFEKKLHNYDSNRSELKAWDKESAMNYHVNWQSVYDKYRNMCLEVCPNTKELANIVATLCYKKYKSKSRKFIWAVAFDGILENIKQEKIMIPEKNNSGEYEYLGRRYSLVEYNPQAGS